MSISDGFSGAVGNTPLIRLRRVSEETGCEILGKAEFGESRWLGRRIEPRARLCWRSSAAVPATLKGTVVEGTAGNTGIGLAHVCNARGYRCVIVMPDNQSPEKYQLLETLGAEVHKVPTGPVQQPEPVSEGSAASGGITPQCYLGQPVRQYDQSRSAFADHGAGNLVTDERSSGCVHGSFWHRRHLRWCRRVRLKSRRRAIRVQSSSIRQAAACSNTSRNGTLKSTGSSSITEGIGIARITANLKDAPIDDAIHVEDADTVRFVYRLLRRKAYF